MIKHAPLTSEDAAADAALRFMQEEPAAVSVVVEYVMPDGKPRAVEVFRSGHRVDQTFLILQTPRT
jgi:hypothetical protein